MICTAVTKFRLFPTMLIQMISADDFRRCPTSASLVPEILLIKLNETTYHITFTNNFISKSLDVIFDIFANSAENAIKFNNIVSGLQAKNLTTMTYANEVEYAFSFDVI